MSTALHISVVPASLVLGDRQLSAQWLELYALVALQHCDDPEGFVTVERIHRLSEWHLKQPGSVGKEIARHVASMKSTGANVLYSPPGSKTRAWRLDLPREALVLCPSTEAVAAWLEAHTHIASDRLSWSRDLRRVLEASMLLRDGRAAAALEVLEVARESADMPLRAWRALSLGRAYYIEGEEEQGDELEALIDEWTGCGEPSGRAVETRLRLLRAMNERFDDAARTRATLTKMVADLGLSGDAGSLGATLNVLGVLERRSGNPSRALEHLTRAVSLLGISGDFQLLQAALYNAALARRSELRRSGQPPDELAFELLDLCLMVCREFKVGGGSALALISYAHWSVDSGLFDQAGRLLGRAEETLRTSEVSYDQAYFLEVRARLSLAEAGTANGCLRDLRAAARLYAEVGDTRAEERVDALVRRLIGGRAQ